MWAIIITSFLILPPQQKNKNINKHMKIMKIKMSSNLLITFVYVHSFRCEIYLLCCVFATYHLMVVNVSKIFSERHMPAAVILKGIKKNIEAVRYGVAAF